MDSGYTVVELAGIKMLPDEKLYLVRMPQDVGVDQVKDLPINKLFAGLSSKKEAQASVSKNRLRAEMDTKTSETKIFRAVTHNDVDGGSEIGPAFEGVVSITKEVVPQDSSGSLKVKVGLPKSEVLRLPVSYAKKSQMVAVQAHLDKTARGAAASKESAPSAKKGSKKRKQAGEEDESPSKKDKSKKKRK